MSSHVAELFVGWMAVIGIAWSLWHIWLLIASLLEVIIDKLVYK